MAGERNRKPSGNSSGVFGYPDPISIPNIIVLTWAEQIIKYEIRDELTAYYNPQNWM
jgi:hypothetical protein